ncbi:MAG: endonuclease/exonuclease/phosphatase family protein [Anaerolineaceae bacterium]|nr:endonuclease/exonuclease/phosphatase family protein [Anaerolineaceae bacterium]
MNKSQERNFRRLLWFLLPVGILILVWFFNVSKAGTRVEGCPQDCAIEKSGTGSTLRILSLNMLHGHPDFENLDARLALIAQEITRLDADIVLLQEVPWTRQHGSAAKFLAEETGMNYLYLRANGNRGAIFFEEGEAILSRYPLKNSSFIEFQPRAGFFEHRVVLHASAETPQGDIDLFVTHLTNGEPYDNEAQAGSLKEFVDREASALAIITGDFNAAPHSAQITSLSQSWVDAFPSANPQAEGFTCCVDDLISPQVTLRKRIDYIFLSPGDVDYSLDDVRVVFDHPFQVDNGWQWASDHAGMFMVISLENID